MAHARCCCAAICGTMLSHIDATNNETVDVRIPKGLNLDVMDDLRMEWVALLLQLLLHLLLRRKLSLLLQLATR